jgi:tetratricopeptide (TPR) repeat protein
VIFLWRNADMELPENIEALVNVISRGINDLSRGTFLWVGAGLSISADYPGFKELAEMLREKSIESLSVNLDAQQTIDTFVEKNGTGEFCNALADIFIPKKALGYHRELMELPWKGIITTNYDELLEDALKDIGKSYIKITLDRNVELTAGRIPLYKVHGDVSEFRSIIFTKESYEGYSKLYSFLEKILDVELKQHSVVFIGYSMKDDRLIEWLKDLGHSGRKMLMISYTVITENDWNSIPIDDRSLFVEANIKPVLLRNYDEIPELISYLVKKIMPKKSDELRFKISFAQGKQDQWLIQSDTGSEQNVDVPWKNNDDFSVSLMEFTRMAEKPVVEERQRDEINTHAVRIGEALGKSLLNDEDRQRIRNSTGQGGQLPMVMIESNDDLILSLPWELLRMDNEFSIRECRIDLVRTTSSTSEYPKFLSPPDRCMKLVINISAPENSTELNYEEEGYRIARSLHEYSEIVFTELGSVDDMVNLMAENDPIGVHFSGHGEPGRLIFEDEEGMENPVTISNLLKKIREKTLDRFPKFFYLSSCHSNTSAKPTEKQVGPTISAAQLHREGIVQVIGYYGPVVDALSTMAEVAIYKAIANNKPTRQGVRDARAQLSNYPESLDNVVHRGDMPNEQLIMFPFAWSQLVFYHRGPDYPLSKEIPKKYIQEQEAKLQRLFTGTKSRKILSTGFIGRRRELHKFRKVLRAGQRIFVFQGLGGLGKSTIASRVLPMITKNDLVFTVWCQEIEEAEDQAGELTNRLSEFGSKIFGDRWVEVSTSVDRIPDANESQRLGILLQEILKKNSITIYLDNMESLLNGPDNEDPEAFGDWKNREIAQIWEMLKNASGDKLCIITSCRYYNEAFNDYVIHVSEMTDNAIFRMMSWFDGLRRLSVVNRTRLVRLLRGHPMAVELLDDLVRKALSDWKSKYGEWDTPLSGDTDSITKEWERIIAPALPKAEERFVQNLLLEAIWKNVLDDPCRRMLFRMTLLLRPWDWNMMMQLGELSEEESITEGTAQKLRETSLLGRIEDMDANGKWVNLFQIHPITAKFITRQFNGREAETLRQETYRRIGIYLEKLVETSPDIRTPLDTGLYFYKCGEFDRAFLYLDLVCESFFKWGMYRKVIEIYTQFEKTEIMKRINPKLRATMFGNIVGAYYRLGQSRKAIEYCERALEIDRDIDDKRGESSHLGNMGLSFAALGEFEKAIEYYQNALNIAKNVNDLWVVASISGNLGLAYNTLGQVEKSIECYQQGLTVAVEIGDQMIVCGNLGNLGNAYSDLGQNEKAIEYYQQAITIAKEINDLRGEGTWIGNLGIAYHILGNREKAIECYWQALDIARKINERKNEGNWLGNLGNIYNELGQINKAIDYYQQALEIAKEIGDRVGEESALGNIGGIYTKQGQAKDAIGYLQQALRIANEIGDRKGQGSWLGNLGAVYSDLGQVEKAREYLNAALMIAREIKDPQMEAIVLENQKESQ